jgi:hypothetical protein
MAYVPPYMGNKQSYITKGVSFKGQVVPQTNLPVATQNAIEKELTELMSHPVSSRSGVLWDVTVSVKSQGKISRIVSVNHAV